jgi:hypothetical protein
MLSLVLYIIPRNLYQKSPDAIWTSFIMTVARCLYISYVHDTTMLLDLVDALTTSQHVLSVCVRSFTEIDNDNDKNVISMQYATPWP